MAGLGLLRFSECRLFDLVEVPALPGAFPILVWEIRPGEFDGLDRDRQSFGESFGHFFGGEGLVGGALLNLPPATAGGFWARIPQVSPALGGGLQHPKASHGQGPFAVRPVLASGAPAR